MSMRERFSDEEWTLVCHVPVDAFMFAALADQKLDEKEIEAFVDTIANAPTIIDPLHREVALTFATRGAEAIGSELVFEATESLSAMDDRFERTKKLLKDKLTTDEYQSFLGSVVASGVMVAQASGKRHLFRKKKTVSDDEAAALATFAMRWEVDLSVLQRYSA